MAKKSKIPKTKMFGGKQYKLWGDGTPERSKKKVMEWLDWQRRVNNHNGRAVRVDGGYVVYMRKNTKKLIFTIKSRTQ